MSRYRAVIQDYVKQNLGEFFAGQGRYELFTKMVESAAVRYERNNGIKLDWKNSVVDLMKALGMPSAKHIRIDMCREMGYVEPEHSGSGPGTDDWRDRLRNDWLYVQIIDGMKSIKLSGDCPDK